MQTKKKASRRNAARELASPMVSRDQRIVSENGQVVEKKVIDIITSSARKNKFASTLEKKGGEPIAATDLSNKYDSANDETSDACLVNDETSDACLVHDAIHGASMDCKRWNEEAAHYKLGNIFSPGFHLSNNSGEKGVDRVDFVKIFHNGDQNFNQDQRVELSDVSLVGGDVCQETSVRMEVDIKISSKDSNAQNYGDQILMLSANDVNCCSSDFDGTGLSSEVPAVYLAMENSKLECIDEHGQDSISTDVCIEDEDSQDFDDFDPYLFIKSLPDLSSVVPTYRRSLLPKQTRSCPPTTLVLDLDETLVHSTLEPCEDADFTFPVNFNFEEHRVHVRCRPHLNDFLERVSGLFEIIIFTASQSIYADQLLNVLDPKRKIFRHRVFRESCVFWDGNYLKDLSVLGRDLAQVIIIDNSPQAFGFQVDNGIPIESWFDDRSDKKLLLLLPFLESLVGVDDVRPLIANKFNLWQKIAAAVHPSFNSNRKDLLSC